jgi:hypothetical protein
MPSTITITEPVSTGLPLPLSSPTSSRFDEVGGGNSSAVTITSYLPGLACPSNYTNVPAAKTTSIHSTIATLSATVITEISGSFTTSLIYGTAVCPINSASSATRSSLSTISDLPLTLYSVSTQYISASCAIPDPSPPFTTSVYTSGASAVSSLSPPSVLLNTVQDNFTTTIYTQNAICNLNSTSQVTAWNNFTTTIYTDNASNTYDFAATISRTRYTTIYEPDITVTLSGTTVTACAYDDFGDDDNDGVPNGQENSSSTISTLTTTTTPVPTVVANLGFENGTQNPLNSTKSAPNIVAQIATSNDSTPLTAYTGENYL